MLRHTPIGRRAEEKMPHTMRILLTVLVLAHGAVTHAALGAETSPYASSEFIEGFNPYHPVSVGTYYANHALYAWRYVANATYDIDRIEFIHGHCCFGTGTGTVRIEVRTAGSSAEFPLNTTILTSGEYEQVAEIGFQGADLPPVRLTGGHFYWIVLAPVVGSQASISDPIYDGDWIYMCYSDDDGSTWTCPPLNAGSLWIARFFGTRVVSVEGSTWGGIKELYSR